MILALVEQTLALQSAKSEDRRNEIFEGCRTLICREQSHDRSNGLNRTRAFHASDLARRCGSMVHSACSRSHDLLQNAAGTARTIRIGGETKTLVSIRVSRRPSRRWQSILETMISSRSRVSDLFARALPLDQPVDAARARQESEISLFVMARRDGSREPPLVSVLRPR